MNQFLHGVARAITETFDLPGPVLEIGSHLVTGQEKIGNLRSLFPQKVYVGLDVQAGPGVDCVAKVESLPQSDASVGTVIAMNTLEHIPCFWQGLEEIYRVLRADGALLLSCPFYFHLHYFPCDYWRFSPQALELLLEAYPSKILGRQGPRKRPASVWALAFREERPPITPAEFDRYRTLVRRYAREPLTWKRGVRYRLGSLLFGRGPFAPYLDRECWETECRTSVLS
jgi:SAM-dependent methyltransferase